MAMLLLTNEQTKELNEIFAAIVKKHSSSATESIYLGTPTRISAAEAAAMAELEIGAKRIKIENDYATVVETIQENADARGLGHSTFVLLQLEKAFNKKTALLERLNDAAAKQAKRILAENQKQILMIEREKSISRSRSVRDFVAVTKLKIVQAQNVQNLIDQEVCDAYKQWLLQYDAAVAWNLMSSNALFLLNLGSKYTQLLTFIDNRR